MEMNKDLKIHIDIPSGDFPLIEYRRDFDVQGRLEGEIFDDMILRVEVLDDRGIPVRHTRSSRKNDDRIWLDHPDLVSYADELDPGRKKLKEFGFPELMVSDLSDPLASLSDATIKCFYSDRKFKSVIVSGSDVKRGRALESGMNYCDENGDPYQTLAEGDYLLRVALCDRDENVLAVDQKMFRIGIRKEAAIVRFNPVNHRSRMEEWCNEFGFMIVSDPLPGYLDPYLGRWYYHMGLLPYYRSNDIAVYAQAQVHMFVYLCDPHSTSYETELAYLQTGKRVADAEWFKAYHYDIGEYAVGERMGKIVEFEKDEVLKLCRIDVVSADAKENVYDLSGKNRIRSFFEEDEIVVSENERIAFSVIVKPQQLDPEDVVLTDENIYVYHNQIETLSYEIDDGERIFVEDRKLMLERIDEGASIGFSVYEAYNVFNLPKPKIGKTLNFSVRAYDRKGKNFGSALNIKVKVI